MPKRKRAWAAWNYMTLPSQKLGRGDERISVTCWMNRLQGLSIEKYGPIFVSINPLRKPVGERGRWVYEHPRLTPASIKGQQLLGTIQNKRGITYAGAWTNLGFHEDAFTSGLQAAKYIEPDLPIDFVDSTFARGQPPLLRAADYLVRAVIQFVQILLVAYSSFLYTIHSANSVKYLW
jgi:predicted NAD/FAD-binding protein